MIPGAMPPTYWDAPGADPWRGSEERAFHLLARATGASVALLESLEHSTCRMRLIRDGERFDAMTFGRHGVLTDVVARLDRWPSSASRLAMVCGDGFGNRLIYPVVCGNWSLELGELPTAPSNSSPVGGWGGWGTEGSEGEEGGGWAGGYSGMAGSTPWGSGGYGYGAAYTPAMLFTPSASSETFSITSPSIAPQTSETGSCCSIPGGSNTPSQPNTPMPTPEPGSAALLAIGIAMTVAMHKANRHPHTVNLSSGKFMTSEGISSNEIGQREHFKKMPIFVLTKLLTAARSF